MSLGSKGKDSRSTDVAAEAAGVSAPFYKELQDTFRLYDSEGTGYLSVKKLQLAMRTVGFEASLSDIQEIVEGMPKLSVHKPQGGKAKGGKKSSHPPDTSSSAVRRSRRVAQSSSKGQTKYADDSDEDTDGDDSDQDTYQDQGGDSEEEEDQPYRFTFNDFIVIMTPGNAQYEKDELARVFQLFDSQGKGYIRMEDLKRVAGELGIPMSDQQLEEMIDEADQDGNGAVTVEEFGRVMKKTGLA